MLSKRALRRRKPKPDFDRWIPREKSTWPFQVFQIYNDELDKNLSSYIPASKYVYSNLKKNGALWEDKVEKHFEIEKGKEDEFVNLKDWSNAFNAFDNWTNLNVLMTISSTFETYLATVVLIALQSDPGLLLGSSQSIDGIYVLKYGSFSRLDYDSHVVACTKGDWGSRISSYEKLFNSSPPQIKANIADLEAIRKLRNNVGHAFGRDIEEARKHAKKSIIPIEALSRERVIKYQRLLWKVAKSIDKHLLFSHIGEFQALNFYHSMYDGLRKDVHASIRAMHFKKQLGQSGVQTAGKLFCKQLVSFYEAI